MEHIPFYYKLLDIKFDYLTPRTKSSADTERVIHS